MVCIPRVTACSRQRVVQDLDKSTGHVFGASAGSHFYKVPYQFLADVGTKIFPLLSCVEEHRIASVWYVSFPDLGC
jgi:hypothetical protein